MLKVVLFLCVACFFIAAMWLLAGIPGHVLVSIGAFTVETSAPVALVSLGALIVVILIMLHIARVTLRVPRTGAEWRRRHRLTLGNRAVTRVLVALAAGEQGTARKEARRARLMLGDSPQTLLLVAEAGRLAGREDEAEEAFRSLTMQKDAEFLGLRGLLRQAIDRRDWPEAQVIAKRAEAVHPGTIWLRQQRAELALETQNWAEAIELVGPDPRRPTYYVAAADAEPDRPRALSYARQAWKQDPAFTPAALAYANRLRAAGQEKRAQSCIADSWKLLPHPDLAVFALATEPDKLARAQAARRLVAGNPRHPESRLLLARVALDAGLTGEARHQVEIAQTEGVNQRRLCLLLAEIEEQDRGDTEAGRLAQRDALRRAATADPDPRWQCANCHTDHVAWCPKCDTCGGVGVVRWLSSMPASTPISGLPVIVG
jgi:HemY protein